MRIADQYTEGRRETVRISGFKQHPALGITNQLRISADSRGHRAASASHCFHE
jgi:hypothetical protein